MPPDTEFHLLEELLKTSQRFTMNPILILEPGACLYNVEIPEKFAKKGINVFC